MNIDEALSRLDPRTADLRALAEALREVDGCARDQMCHDLARRLNDPTCARNEDDRVASVKLLLALLPASTNIVVDCLSRHESMLDCEIQFSLFCFMDRLESVPEAKSVWQQVPEMASRYIERAKSDPCNAVWMAADLLGGHLPLAVGLPSLQRLSTKPLSAEGASALVHGIAEAVRRAEGGDRSALIDMLSAMALTSSSVRVRAAASLALGRFAESTE